jgi:hypothetical protein
MNFLDMVRKIDWVAVSALATLAAVIVALLPLYREQRRQKGIARNLRVRLAANLIVVRDLVERHLNRTYSHGRGLSEGEIDAIRSLDALIPELIILKKDEHLPILMIIPDIKRLLADPAEIFKKFDRSSLDALNKILIILERNLNKSL